MVCREQRPTVNGWGRLSRRIGCRQKQEGETVSYVWNLECLASSGMKVTEEEAREDVGERMEEELIQG